MAKAYHHLTYEQRCQLYALKKRGDSVSTIAKILGVHRSTIYREIERNSGKRGYRYRQAQQKSSNRRSKGNSHPHKLNSATIATIESKLLLQWSPEQISGWMKRESFPISVSHEAIYQYIWKDKRQGGFLYKQLRHRGKKYQKRSSNRAGRGYIPNRVDIDNRPKIVEKKLRQGDWEIDTIIGGRHKGAIVSIVDRASKLTKLIKVSKKGAKDVERAVLSKLGQIKNFVVTITADNGKEFANHQEISKALEAEFFFAKPYHSWERGLNEHTNGLVRQYFPKSMSFEKLTQDHLDRVEFKLNNRPRKVLEFRTPIEAFEELKIRTPIVALHI